ncbi:hypothetical protein TIFTF001_014041 [Ficus carica]|uniref:Uncharacterized protein n=1 Tax=Ficus carica TaxID=3494 RepID=A0AA88A343_FICCA|nr:hypothetical protein TIFTF001_014041 [Ficus carica]
MRVAGRGWGRWWGGQRWVAGGGKVAGDREDFRWEG